VVKEVVVVAMLEVGLVKPNFNNGKFYISYKHEGKTKLEPKGKTI
jgi:hypothetical protein